MTKISGLTAFNNAMCLLYNSKEDKKEAWCDAVVEVLGKLNVDYNALYKHILNEYKSDFLPSPATLKELAKPFIKKTETQAMQWRQPILKSPRSGNLVAKWCFPLKTTDEQIIKTIEHYEHCTGWELVSG